MAFAPLLPSQLLVVAPVVVVVIVMRAGVVVFVDVPGFIVAIAVKQYEYEHLFQYTQQ